MLVGEFCKITGLGRETVRFYVRKGLLKPQATADGTNRYQQFDMKLVERAKLIREAQALGFSLKEISVLAEQYERGDLTLQLQADLLRERLCVIDNRARKLRELRRYFVAKLKWLESGSQGRPPSFSSSLNT